MAMEVNGSAILQAIAKTPAAFAMTQAQVSALAMQTLLLKLKDKGLDLNALRSITKAIGKHDFGLALDHLPARDLSGMVKRLDPKHPDLKTADEQWQRIQIVRLAEGDVEPTTAVSKAARAPKTAPRDKTPKTGDIMNSVALAPKQPVKKRSSKITI